MVRLHVDRLLKAKKWSWYKLAAESGLSLGTIYKLKAIQERDGGEFARLDAATIDNLCRAFGCQPGDLLSYTPDRRKGAA